MELQKLEIQAFAAQLAGKAPVPGGGGASALAGALGAALGSMVGALTVGKKKYAAVEQDVQVIMARMEKLRARLLALIDEDAAAFLPLSRAYGMPRETDEERAARAAVMAEALDAAAQPPLRIMESCCEAIELHRELAEKGSALALSDVGVGVILCKAALQGAELNVRINTGSMQDRARAAALNAYAARMLDDYLPVADAVYDTVRGRLG